MPEEEKKTETMAHVLSVLAEWLKGQPFNNVMSIVLIAMIGGIGYHVVNDVIPQERMAIQGMAEQIEAQHTKQIERITASFDRTLDRVYPPTNSRKRSVEPGVANGDQ